MEAHEFTLQDKDGNEHSLPERGVLYFYPKDDTPGCTVEAKEFSDLLDEFEEEGYTVYGISGGTKKSKQKFCDKHDLTVTLLNDPGFEVSKRYGVYGPKTFAGNEYKGITRTTFIIEGSEVVKRYDNVKAKGHAKEVLEWVRSRD